MGAQEIILPLNSPKWGVLAPSLAFLDQNFMTKTFSYNCPTTQNLGEAIAPLSICHDAIDCDNDGVCLQYWAT